MSEKPYADMSYNAAHLIYASNADEKNKAVMYTILVVLFNNILIPTGSHVLGFLGVLISLFCSFWGYKNAQKGTWLHRQMTELLNYQLNVVLLIVAALFMLYSAVMFQQPFIDEVAKAVLILAIVLNFIWFIAILFSIYRISKGKYFKYPLIVQLISD